MAMNDTVVSLPRERDFHCSAVGWISQLIRKWGAINGCCGHRPCHFPLPRNLVGSGRVTRPPSFFSPRFFQQFSVQLDLYYYKPGSYRYVLTRLDNLFLATGTDLANFLVMAAAFSSVKRTQNNSQDAEALEDRYSILPDPKNRIFEVELRLLSLNGWDFLCMYFSGHFFDANRTGNGRVAGWFWPRK